MNLEVLLMKDYKQDLFMYEGESELLSLSSSYPIRDLEDLEERTANHYTYGRLGNPTRDMLAKRISELEDAQRTLICSSGMAAISTSLLSLLKQGDVLLANQSLYGETMELCEHILSKYDIQIQYADFQNPLKLREMIKKYAVKMLYTEGISNPITEVADMKMLADLAHETGALLVIDHTFSTPYLAKPLTYGADLVIHSLTKFINGHSDVTLGSISGGAAIMEDIYQHQILFGSVGDPFSCWLCLRGLKTMMLRAERQNENARQLAAHLADHPKVSNVFHPSLVTHPQHALAKRQYRDFGAMMSFRIKDDRGQVNRFLKSLQTAAYVPSLGGVRTTLSHPVSSSHAGVEKAVREAMGIHEGLLRVSVGIEPIKDIIADFDQALAVLEDPHGESK